MIDRLRHVLECAGGGARREVQAARRSDGHPTLIPRALPVAYARQWTTRYVWAGHKQRGERRCTSMDTSAAFGTLRSRVQIPASRPECSVAHRRQTRASAATTGPADHLRRRGASRSEQDREQHDKQNQTKQTHAYVHRCTSHWLDAVMQSEFPSPMPPNLGARVCIRDITPIQPSRRRTAAATTR
jgi:hypothetical protein